MCIRDSHHCGYGAIQQHSSVEHDYLTDGFWAKSRKEELPTPGLKFKFVERIVDVTDKVNNKVKSGEVKEEETFEYDFLKKLADEELKASDLNGKAGMLSYKHNNSHRSKGSPQTTEPNRMINMLFYKIRTVCLLYKRSHRFCKL